jgi:hypothetical protein
MGTVRKIRLLLWIVGILIGIYVLMLVITSIRTLFGGNARAEELKVLLTEVKTVFQEASQSFEALDSTYEKLDGEYLTVFDSARAITVNLDQVDAIANGLTNEFDSVTKTFMEIEGAYTGVIDQYNKVCAFAGLAYIKTGAFTDGLPITVVLYPYGGTRESSITVVPTYVYAQNETLIYTDENNYVDSRKRTDSESNLPHTTIPILRAWDKDGNNMTRDTSEAGVYKTITAFAAVIDGKYELSTITASIPLESHVVETFELNPVLTKRISETREKNNFVYVTSAEVPQLSENSMYIFQVSAAGKPEVLRLTPDEIIAIDAGNNIPVFKPATLLSLTQIEGRRFESITPMIQRVKDLNQEKDGAMKEAIVSSQSIAKSNEARQIFARTHQDLVKQFELLDVDSIVPKKDLLDSYCVLM